MFNPMNNPVMTILQMAQNGMTPMQALDKMAPQNSRFAQAKNLIYGKSPEQLQQIAENMAKQRGTSVEEIASRFGISINKQGS